MSLLEASGVTVCFTTKGANGVRKSWAAVRGVDLVLKQGERLGVVGESGSGKTTLARALLALEPLAGGTVNFDSEPVHTLSGQRMKAFRRRAQMVFQDPMGSLNPRMTVGSAIAEVLAVHRLARRVEREQMVGRALEAVGLDTVYARRYPHEFSGGQRQRVGIARALVLNPDLLVADEPVSALDVSVQAQILNLLRDLSMARGMACLLIAHDLAVVRYICERVMVMYKGRVVEEGPSAPVFGRPMHPYTRLLRESVPDPEHASVVNLGVAEADSMTTADGQSSSGCGFAPRCSLVTERCRVQEPAMKTIAEGWRVACHAVQGCPAVLNAP